MAVLFGIEAMDTPAILPHVRVKLDHVTAPASVIRNGAVALFAKVSPAQNLTSSHPVTVEERPNELAASLM